MNNYDNQLLTKKKKKSDSQYNIQEHDYFIQKFCLLHCNNEAKKVQEAIKKVCTGW